MTDSIAKLRELIEALLAIIADRPTCMVMKDRTVSLNGRLYEADAVLVGQTVTVRYDPGAPPTRPVLLVHEGRPAGRATPLDAYANAAMKRARPSRRRRSQQAMESLTVDTVDRVKWPCASVESVIRT